MSLLFILTQMTAVIVSADDSDISTPESGRVAFKQTNGLDKENKVVREWNDRLLFIFLRSTVLKTTTFSANSWNKFVENFAAMRCATVL